jgi:cyanophycinase-like exopeptidase
MFLFAKHIFFFCLILSSLVSFSQNYTSFFTGNPNDVSTNPQFGICLIGGATEPDAAMQWFLNLADGGDVLVIRATGSDAYNDYFFNQLGVSINSVETIRINNPSGAVAPYVLQKLSQAEAIWFAGGDQADYVFYFKDTNFESILNDHINVKNYPIGGISAGMAIMGEYYFDAMNGTVTSQESLSDPFDSRVSLGFSDFIDIPFLAKTITDTHYDNPDRKGRHSTFLARIQNNTNERVFGIGIDEYTSVCIDATGIAHIYGEYPSFDDYAYFIQVNCLPDPSPENLNPNQALDWNLNQEAIKAYRVPGNTLGSNSFDLNTWESGSGGQWENWWIDQGMFMSQSSTPIDCDNLNNLSQDLTDFKVYPNPFQDRLVFSSQAIISSVQLYDLNGNIILASKIFKTFISLDTTHLSSGIYLAKVNFENGKITTLKVLKK